MPKPKPTVNEGIAGVMEAIAKEGNSNFLGLTESTERPQAREMWVHETFGGVEVLRRWNDKESVCNVKGRNMLLMDALMIGRFDFDEEKKGFRFIRYIHHGKTQPDPKRN